MPSGHDDHGIENMFEDNELDANAGEAIVGAYKHSCSFITIDPARAVWQVQGGFNGTDYNGLTYGQVKEGRLHAGSSIDDLWPSMSNVDDAQQFVADMIAASARLTT
ncbi:hypothetical protein [Bifidobacterium bohemicum]|nr:hypothetical protein [Bifidobacterium bohemicum]